MMHRVRRIGIYQTSLVVAALYGALGLLFVPIVWVMGRIVPTEGASTLGGFGLVFMIGMPILYAVIGFVTTAIACVIYNILAGITGGIELELVPSESSI